MQESPKLILEKSDAIDDWYLIVRAEHDGRSWLEPMGPGAAAFMCSERISDADVEGYGSEMLGIAEAIRSRSSFRAKRCAVRIEGDRAYFESPRNSRREGSTSLAEADALAALIEQQLGGTPLPLASTDPDGP